MTTRSESRTATLVRRYPRRHLQPRPSLWLMRPHRREAHPALSCTVAIAEIQRTALDGKPTRVFRLGEWVPFILVSKSGGATGNKQFENVAAPDEVILHGTPVNLSLLYNNRLFPALFGQATFPNPAMITQCLHTCNICISLSYSPPCTWHGMPLFACNPVPTTPCPRFPLV